MPTVNRFEDLEVWNLARMQCNEVYTLIQSGAFKEDRDLRGQMNRSSASVMDAISEGFERFTRADFRHFLVIAKGSNGEMRSQLHRMLDRRFVSDALHQRLVAANKLLGSKLYSFIQYLSGCKYKDKGGSAKTSFISESDTTYMNPGDQDERICDLPEEFIIKP